MLRYLWAAFTARPKVPGLGAVPANVLAVGALAVLGTANPAFWVLGLGLEAAYLFGLASNARFQSIIDSGRFVPPPPRVEAPPERVVPRLPAADRLRLERLNGELSKILSLYSQFQVDDFTTTQNSEALSTLSGHFARLLVARTNIDGHWTGDVGELTAEASGVEADLSRADLTPELRASKTRTLEILRARIENQKRKNQVVEEIDSEINRIEEQFALALENAAIGSQPGSVSAELGFDLSRYDAEPVGADMVAARSDDGGASERRRAKEAT